MGTRFFCDLCGLPINGTYEEISSHRRIRVSSDYDRDEDDDEDEMPSRRRKSPKKETDYSIDLHPKCSEIWWGRMKEIAAAADK